MQRNIQKTHSFPQLLQLIFLKTQAYNSKYTKSSLHAGVELLPVRASSVEEHLPHALTQLRTHARTTRTRNETETDFPIGFS